MNIGIIGLPQTGKKQLFSLLTGHKPSEKELSLNKTIVGVADVRDPRFDALVNLYNPKKQARARIDVEVLPKIEKDSIESGNFFKDISLVDAVCHVVRAFTDDSVYHVDGTVDPKRDIDLVNSELVLNDLIFIEKRLERIEKDSKRVNNALSAKEKEVLLKIKAHLDKELPIRIMDLSADEKKVISGYPFMTQKEMIIALNVSEDAVGNTDLPETLKNNYKHLKTDVMQVSLKLESEIAELKSEQERKDFLMALGIKEPAIDVLTRSCGRALNLISFFTVGPDEVKQWTIKSGSSAPVAAGAIHTDIERGFIRAEVMKYDDLISLGGEEKLKEAGKFHLKGKDYLVEDGDIMNFRFSV